MSGLVFPELASLPESERQLALQRFRILQPHLEQGVTLTVAAAEAGIAYRTAKRWVSLYRRFGLVALARKGRADHGARRTISVSMKEIVEALALQKPPRPISSIYQQVCQIARQRNEKVPSYAVVYDIVRHLPSDLVMLAHEGSKAYGDAFELVHRREAERPNAIWQADHTLLDILVIREDGNAAKPWLTIIIDDYSRAIAGYFLSFEAPSAIQTALALRQAIWRKSEAHWSVCGIPEVLYTDNGSDFKDRHKDERPRRSQDCVLTVAIQKAFEESQGTYGDPRLVRELRKRGLRTSKTRIRRLMKSEGLCPRQKRRVRVRTTKSNPSLPVAPHLLLEAPPAKKPGERFHSDITYIPTQEGWLFMAATLDAYSRKCAGWSAADNMETPLVLRAAERALAVGNAKIHHSDRGSQYASQRFRDFLQENDVDQSMSRKANCYDNALVESFWATLKTECFDNFRSGIPATRGEAKQKLFAYIEVFYNRKRLHSSLGCQSPVEFEGIYFSQKEETLSLSVSS